MIWEDLTSRDRNNLRERYRELRHISEMGYSPYNKGQREILEKTFGEDNLLTPAEEEKPSGGRNKNPRTFYKTQTFLNLESSSFTEAVVCYDGEGIGRREGSRYSFLEIADCNQKVRLHCDTLEEFLTKLKLLQGVIEDFITHLEKNVH